MLTAEKIIDFFDMKPLPDEGGFYTETYRAAEKIPISCLPERYTSDRTFCTVILYLITPQSFSKLHMVKSDEVFHFHLGDPIEMLRLYPDGSGDTITLGSDFIADEKLQVAIPQGTWQGCRLKEGGSFALTGCSVAPGFEFADYQNCDRNSLLEKYPQHADMIIKLS